MAIGVGVSHRGLVFEDYELPWNLTGTPVKGTDEGKAVSQDASARSAAKLAADGDEILGVLRTIENRSIEGIYIGTVAHRFGARLTIKALATVAVGDYLCGGGSGTVRAVSSGTSRVRAVEVPGDGTVIALTI